MRMLRSSRDSAEVAVLVYSKLEHQSAARPRELGVMNGARRHVVLASLLYGLFERPLEAPFARAPTDPSRRKVV